jgi:hypothetical protein
MKCRKGVVNVKKIILAANRQKLVVASGFGRFDMASFNLQSFNLNYIRSIESLVNRLEVNVILLA